MKYECEIKVERPREQVVDLVLDRTKYEKWQKGLVGMTPVTTSPETKGRKTRLSFEMGKRTIEMVETVVELDAPKSVVLYYESKGVENWMRSRFEEVGDEATLWHVDVEFKMGGMMKVMGWLMPKMFESQTRKTLEDFKRFAESP